MDLIQKNYLEKIKMVIQYFKVRNLQWLRKSLFVKRGFFLLIFYIVYILIFVQRIKARVLQKEDNYTLPENKKEIKLAKYAGFCYGVKRAVETVKKLKNENPDKKVFVLGELIHNTQVIHELESLGIKTLNEIPEKGEGICVIRSHGESPQVIEKIKQAGFEPVDLTCPDVKKVQQKAVELAKDGYFVVIVGKSEHPEVIAIRANAELWSDNVVVAASVEQLKEFEARIKKLPIGDVGGIISVAETKDGESRLLISANEKSKYSQLISDEFFKKIK